MTIALNGTPINGNVSSGDLSLGTITTTQDNCVIIVGVEQNSGDSGGTNGSAFFTSSSGLTYTRRAFSGAVPFLGLWVAVKPTAGAETITVKGGVGHGYLEATAAAFSGIDTSTLYDSNPTAGFYVGSNNENGYLTTNNANDLLVAVSRTTGSGADTGNGWTNAISGAFFVFEYKVVSATGTYKTTIPGTHNGLIMDAFVQAGSPAKTKTMKVAVNSTDIAGPNPGSTSCPWLNIWKTGQLWRGQISGGGTASDPSWFNTDADNYIQSMTLTGGHGTLDSFDCGFMNGFDDSLADYPDGASNPYVFMWDGGEDGVTTFTFIDDAAGNGSITQSAGASGRRKVFTVTGTAAGFYVRCTALGATHPYNFRLVCSPGSTQGGTVGTNEDLLENQNKIINPAWKTALQSINCDRFRAMNWMNTNGTVDNGISSFASRDSHPSSAFWYGNHGVPMEAMVAAANEVGMDLWVTFPLLYTDAAVEDMCANIYSGTTDSYSKVWPGLDTASGRRICTEYFNECWIATRSATQVLGHDYFDQDNSLFGTDGFTQHFQFCLMRQIQTNNIFRAKWLSLGGVAANHVRVLAGNQGARSRNEAFLMNNTTTGAGTGSTFTPFSFTTTNGSVSGTTFTPGAGLSGTVSKYQELTGSGVPAATYIELDNGDGTWELNHNCGTIASQAFSGDYWTGKAIQAGTNAYNKYFDEFCTATYFNGTQDGSETEAQFWAENDADLFGHCTSSIANDCYSCNSGDAGKGIPLVAYEGGQQYFAATSGAYDAAKDALFTPAQFDYRMGLAYDYWLETQDNAGYSVCCHYTEFGRKEQSSFLAVYWGALFSPYTTPVVASPGVPGTPKWNSLVTFAALVNGAVSSTALRVLAGLLAFRLHL